MRIMLLDDEKAIVDELKYILDKYKSCQVVGAFNDSDDFIRNIADLQPDAVFIDIDLGKVTGFDIAEKLLNCNELNKRPLIVFATAYDEYAIKAFEYEAIDYILKPFDEERIKASLNRIERILNDKNQSDFQVTKTINMLSQRKIDKLMVINNGRFKVIPFDKIFYIKAKQGVSEAYTADGTYMSEFNLSQLENRLGEKFMRIHKSYIINLDKITEVIPWFKGTYWVVINDMNKTEIPVSKEKIKEIKQVIF